MNMLTTMTATRTFACSDSNVSFRMRAHGTFKADLWWPAGVHYKLNTLLLVQGIRDNWVQHRHKHRNRLRHFQVGSKFDDQVQVDDFQSRSEIYKSLKEYMQQFDYSTSSNNQNHNSNDVIESSSVALGGGGPTGPRWFAPLDCGPASSFGSDSVGYDDKASNLKPESLPLLLYLPGIDGTGLGLVRNHHKLSQIFDVWCLHIPVTDRTPFTELMKLVEGTVRSEYNLSPNRPIYLIGESLGACLALSVAANNPNIDLMLILANPATSFDRSNLLRLKPFLELMPSQSLPGGEAISMLKDAVLKQFTQPRVLEDIFEGLEALLSYSSVVTSTLSVATLLWKIELLKASSAYVNSRLHAIKAPTLLLSGGKDTLLPSLEEGERLSHALPICDFRKFKDNGHFLFLEDGVDLVLTIKGTWFYRRGKHRDCIADYLQPTPSEYRRTLGHYKKFFNSATSPVMLSTLENGQIVRGLAGIPSDGPTLLVGQHSLFGIELIPIVSSFIEEKNIFLRGTSHSLLFDKPKVARYFEPALFDIIRVMGSVLVSPLRVFSLLASESHVLLYPGGVRESIHRKGEFYKLFWPEKPEFVRMAAKCGAKIIPFCVMGADDLIEIIADYDDFSMFPFINELIKEKTNLGINFSMESGETTNEQAHLPILAPKVPGRLYYLFGKPIETEGMRQELMDKENALEMYLHIKSEVERCIEYLKERREHDPYRNILPRMLYQSIHGSTSQVPTFEL